MRKIARQLHRKGTEIGENDFRTYYLSKRDRVYRVPDGIAYRLWNTVILTYRQGFNHPMIQVNTSGHRTATTKSRINDLLTLYNIPFRIYQKDFIWYWSNGVEFEDHDVIMWFLSGWEVMRADTYFTIKTGQPAN